MRLTDIWPGLGSLLGRKRLGESRRTSHTKKGPGRRHQQGKAPVVTPDLEGKTVVASGGLLGPIA